jgi:long-chain acyl-CoA synthetase
VPAETVPFPRWNRRCASRFVREFSLSTWILPLAGLYARVRVEGLEHLRGLEGPVIFASNHQSHFDTAVILGALPQPQRRRVAVAMWKEYFEAHFAPRKHSLRERWLTSTLYYLVALLFNAFPLPVAEPGARETIRYIGDLVSDRWSILIFPEGERTEHGEIRAFQPGVGILGSRLLVPVVPVRLEGVDRVLHRTWRWPRRGDVTVAFGAPITMQGDDYAALARRVREAVVALRPSDANAPASRSA